MPKAVQSFAQANIMKWWSWDNPVGWPQACAPNSYTAAHIVSELQALNECYGLMSVYISGHPCKPQWKGQHILKALLWNTHDCDLSEEPRQ